MAEAVLNSGKVRKRSVKGTSSAVDFDGCANRKAAQLPRIRWCVIEEHRAVRNAAGLFDIDHMGQVRVTGPDALAYLNYLLTANFSDMEADTAKYAVMCYADGTCVDDTFVYRLAN